MSRRQGAYRVSGPATESDETHVHQRPTGPSGPARARGGGGRRPRGKRLLALIAGVVVMGLAIGGIVLWQRAAAFNDAVSTAPMLSSRLFGPLGSGSRVNVLLLGYAPEGRDGALLTDSITLLSIDTETDETTAVAIPRDLWVEDNPRLPGNGKINEAFAVGYRSAGWEEAGDNAVQLIEDVTGVEAVGWIAVDFDGFRSMVDAVDGITVDNPTAFRWALGADEHAAGTWAGEFPAGPIQLGGMDALQYSRVRYTDQPQESSDYARSVRQHRVIAAIRAKIGLGPDSVGRLLALADALRERLHTNLSVFDLLLLSRHLEIDRRVELIEGAVLEATRNSVGQYVLVVLGRSQPSDYEPLHRYIEQELSESGAPP